MLFLLHLKLLEFGEDDQSASISDLVYESLGQYQLRPYGFRIFYVLA